MHSNLTNKVFFVQCIYFVAWHQFQSHSNLRMQQRGHVRSILKTFTLSKLFNLKIPTGKFEKYFFMPKCFFPLKNSTCWTPKNKSVDGEIWFGFINLSHFLFLWSLYYLNLKTYNHVINLLAGLSLQIKNLSLTYSNHYNGYLKGQPWWTVSRVPASGIRGRQFVSHQLQGTFFLPVAIYKKKKGE